ncbi:MAG: hypothetical protein KAU12_00585 [Candidatus Omnitrophica bacterium]|nr:hypothetical protein [Candidatus Omnitrophota bacterium]
MEKFKRLTGFIIFSFISVVVSVEAGVEYKKGINCGGPAYTASDGKKFSADVKYRESLKYGYMDGNDAASSSHIGGTKDKFLFKSERWGFSEYRFDLPKGVYLVSLYLAETHFKNRGERVFNVDLEGRTVVNGLDMIAAYGKNEAEVLKFAVRLNDGRLNIKAAADIDSPKLCAIYVENILHDTDAPLRTYITKVVNKDSAVGLLWKPNKEFDVEGYEVFRVEVEDSYIKTPFIKISEGLIEGTAYLDRKAENGKRYFYAVKSVDVFGNKSKMSEPAGGIAVKSSPEDLILRINCGAGEFIDEKGRVYKADEEYNIVAGFGYDGGRPVDSREGVKIASGYQFSLREGFKEYLYDVPDGIYKVALEFIEPWNKRAGRRQFSLFIEEKRVVRDLDIFFEAERYNILRLEFITRVNDGQLNIRAVRRMGEPVISFIEIEPARAKLRRPARVGGLKIDAREDRLYLFWDAAKRNDIIGYNIYKITGSERRAEKINETLVGIEMFKDTDVEAGGEYSYLVSAVSASLKEGKRSRPVSVSVRKLTDDDLLDIIQKACFKFFWDEADQVTGLIKDKTSVDFVSTASVGFGLSALVVGAEREYLKKDIIEERVYNILNALSGSPKKFGLFFHYLDFDAMPSSSGYESGVSSVDSGILLMGVITAGEYFGGRVKKEADKIVAEADWSSFLDKSRGLLYMAWGPANLDNMTGDGNFYCAWDHASDETIICTLLGISAPKEEHRIQPATFYKWRRPQGRYQPLTAGYRPTDLFVYSWSGCLFTYQFAHCWVDFKSLGRDNGPKLGVNSPRIDWDKNVIEATKAARLYCIDRKKRFRTFGEDSWGLTACASKEGYITPGAMPKGDMWDDPKDGTIAPYGAGCSLPYLPAEVMRALWYYYNLKDEKGERLVWQDEYEGGYGFWDSFNLDSGYVAKVVIGIDQGPLILAIENYRSGLIQETFMKNKHIRRGINRIGFENKLSID